MAKGETNLPVPRTDLVKARRRVSVKNWRGVVYLSKWQPPRGVPKSSRQAAWVCNFRKIARMSKTPTPQELDAAKMWAEGTTWYYRDVIERALTGVLIVRRDEPRVITPTANVARLATQNVTNATLTTVNPDQLYWDNNAFWNVSLNPSRLTFRSPGLYLLIAYLQWSTNGSSYRKASFIKNGSLSIGDLISWPTSEGPTDQMLMTADYFHAADYVEVKLHQNSGGTRTITMPRFIAIAITPEALVP